MIFIIRFSESRRIISEGRITTITLHHGAHGEHGGKYRFFVTVSPETM